MRYTDLKMEDVVKDIGLDIYP